MNRIKRLVVGLLATIGLCSGCVTVNPHEDYQRAAAELRTATAQTGVFQPGDEEVLNARVDELLAHGITADEAVQVALLNNPELQAAFFDIGMARADLVQSGLLSNPSVGGAVKFPSGGGLVMVDAFLAQGIGELWQIPARVRAAERQLDRAILEVARKAADLVAEARTAYYDAVGAEQLQGIARENLSVAKNLFELTLVRREVGAGSELDVNLAQTVVLEAEWEAERARLGTADARRTLAKIMGLSSDANALQLTDRLPETPAVVPPAERVLEAAIDARLDVRIARRVADAAEANLELEELGLLSGLSVGVELERDPRPPSSGGGSSRSRRSDDSSVEEAESMFLMGPSVELELPIFHQYQAPIARAEYRYEQALRSVDALERAVAQEVRGAVDRTVTAWKLAQLYRDGVLPLATSNMALAREAYQSGKVSWLSVLEAQRTLNTSRSRYVEAVRDASIAAARLERAAGAPLARLREEAEPIEKPEHSDQKPEGRGEP